MEKLAYTLLGVVAILYLIAIVVGLVAAFPFGIIGFLVLGGIGILFWKAFSERVNNAEDDYYDKNVDQ